MWNVPADHEIFQGINAAQWLWYFYNFIEDQEESFIQKRDLVEYNASFVEPEAVRKIREAREKAIEVPEDQFVAGLKHFFGRDLSTKKKPGGKIESVDPRAAIANYKVQKNIDNGVSIDRKGLGYKHWLDSDLEK